LSLKNRTVKKVLRDGKKHNAELNILDIAPFIIFRSLTL